VADVEDRAKAAVAHFQSATLEMIAAARSLLDVAEELVKDPTPLTAFAMGVAQAAAQAGAHVAAADGEAQPRVQHIRVS